MYPPLVWDPRLNELTLEHGQVVGLKAGLQRARVAPGQLVLRLSAATFLGEPAAQGRHVVSVDVVDDAHRRLAGYQAQQGWPWERWPSRDGLASMPVTDKPAEFGIFAAYDPFTVEYGPYWVQVVPGAEPGAPRQREVPSDVFYGLGLPFSRRVAWAVVFQLTTEPAAPRPTAAHSYGEGDH